MKRRVRRTTPRGAAIPPLVRISAGRVDCAICHARFGHIQTLYRGDRVRPWVPRQHFDHIIAVRFVRGMNLGDPNVSVNVACVCHRCNLGKKGAEDRLFAFDILGFTQRLVRLGWGPKLYDAAANFDLWNVCKLLTSSV